MASKRKDVPAGTNGDALPEKAEKKWIAFKATLETIERMYKGRPFLAFILVNRAINVLDEKRSARPWVIGGSVTLGSGILVAAGKTVGFF